MPRTAEDAQKGQARMECKHLLHAGFNWKGLSTTFFQGMLEMMESSGRKWVCPFPGNFLSSLSFPKHPWLRLLWLKRRCLKKPIGLLVKAEVTH